MVSVIHTCGFFGSRRICFKGSNPNIPHALVPLAAANQDGYIGSDGRRKATMEEAFRTSRVSGDELPWKLSWQRNERQLTFTDQTTVHIVKVGHGRNRSTFFALGMCQGGRKRICRANPNSLQHRSDR